MGSMQAARSAGTVPASGVAIRRIVRPAAARGPGQQSA